MKNTDNSDVEFFLQSALGEMDIAGFIVPAINAPIILLDRIKPFLLKDKKFPFAVLYWDTPEGRSFAMFTDKPDVDVGKIAANYYQGTGSKDLAVFKTPPQRDLAGEFIPLELEFPPDDIDVIALFKGHMNGSLWAKQAHHFSDGEFESDQGDMSEIVAWAYMPELPQVLDNQVQ